MRKALSEIEVIDVFKVKIDDGTFFGGQDLVEWLCSRLKQELAFSAEVRKELQGERLASSREFDRLSENEKRLKNELRDKQSELETAERRLLDTTEALHSQKQLRMKEMLVTQGAAKEINSLQSEVSRLTNRINLQADVTAAVEKECEALRSTVRTGREVRDVEDVNFRKTLAETIKREEGMVRLKRRLHAAEAERRESEARVSRLQREMDRMRAALWAHGINPASAAAIPGNNKHVVSSSNAAAAANATRIAQKGAHWRRPDGPARRRDQKNKLAPLAHLGSSSSRAGLGNDWGGSTSSASSAAIGFRRRFEDNADAQALRGWKHT
ncbi:hypothetical protein Esi_0110_0017 [Ectocarpus siliculosus]|uniref:Uncharacterized protein n=1 Tax=Ectocarpus siliculosus TaxID=2880 RepID=D7FHP9_ECTSI|nr:hypothetical protein Esi_0110_0017 [Ectocarpus siliculosus]|eukprot:CBJ28604.1 hypothetical protein Esi_0110_0017 [Ectocarpus siliculosus]